MLRLFLDSEAFKYEQVSRNNCLLDADAADAEPSRSKSPIDKIHTSEK